MKFTLLLASTVAAMQPKFAQINAMPKQDHLDLVLSQMKGTNANAHIFPDENGICGFGGPLAKEVDAAFD